MQIPKIAHQGPESPPPSSAWSGRDAVVAVVLVVGLVAFYGATFQERLTIDGAGLAGMAQLGEGRGYYNVLYLPLVRGVAALLPGPIDLAQIRAASALFAAFGVGACYLIVRRFGVSLFPALVATLLWAFSPGLWFYGTTIETHAVHAGVAGLVTLLFLSLPWSRPWAAVALACLLMPFLLWTQQVSIFLGPGLVLLADQARRRHGSSFSKPQLLFGVGPILLGGFVIGLLGANLYRFGQISPSVDGQVSQILFDKGSNPTWWTEWLVPLGVLEGLALLGLMLTTKRSPLTSRARVTLLVLVAPAIAFFSWWGVFERGGYFLGSAPFHVVLAAAALESIGRARIAALVAIPLLATQIYLGCTTLQAYDVGWIPAQRVAQVRSAIGEKGLLLSTINISPPLRTNLSEAEELPLWEACKQALIRSNGEYDPKGLTPWVLARITRELNSGRRVAVELGYREADAVNPDRIYFDALDAIMEGIEDRFVLRKLEHPHWPLSIIVEERATGSTPLR